MEANPDKNQPGQAGSDHTDCGCGSDCCPPKGKKWWPKLIFLTVLAFALFIIAWKLFLQPAPPVTSQPCCPDTTTAVQGDSSATNCRDTANVTSCCPK